MKKWSNQNFEEQQRKFVDFETKRKITNQNKLENDPESSTILRNANRNDQQNSYPLQQNESLLKRVILLEQRTRDYDDIHFLCQNLDRKVQELDHKYDQIYQWAKSREDEQIDQSLISQIQERIVELEENVKNISNKPASNFEEVLQNDLNTLYDIIKCHESNNTDLLENQKQLKQELVELAAQLQQKTAVKSPNYNSNTINSKLSTMKPIQNQPRQSIEESDQDLIAQGGSGDKQFKKQRSLLNVQKNDLNSSVEKVSQQRQYVSPGGNLNNHGAQSNKRQKDIDQVFLMERSTIHKESDGCIQTREPFFDSQWGGQPQTEKNQAWNNTSKGRKQFPEQAQPQQQLTKTSFLQQQPQPDSNFNRNNMLPSNQRMMQSFAKKKEVSQPQQQTGQQMKSFKL